MRAVAETRTSFGRALQDGLRLTASNWRVPALGFAVEAAQGALFFGVQALFLGLIAAAAQRAFVTMRPDLLTPAPIWFLEAFANALAGSRAWLPAVGAAVVAVLIGLVLRLFWMGYAVRTFTAAAVGSPVEGLATGAAAFPRVVQAALLLAPLWLGTVLWRIAALGSAGMGWGIAMGSREGGVGASLAFALALVLAMLLELGMLFLTRLTLVRAASADAGPFDALRGGGAVLLARPGAVLGLGLLFGIAEVVALFVGQSGGALVMGRGPEAIALMVGARAISGVLGSLLLAGIGSAQLGAYTLLDLGERGLLPEPPQQEPVAPPGGLPESEPLVLETEAASVEPVLETEPVLDTAPAAEPILDTEPVPAPDEPDEGPGGPRNPVLVGA